MITILPDHYTCPSLLHQVYGPVVIDDYGAFREAIDLIHPNNSLLQFSPYWSPLDLVVETIIPYTPLFVEL